MKDLLIFRHSIKESDGLLGEKGLALAKAQGANFHGIQFDKLFHSILPRTMQTALAFVAGQISDGDHGRTWDLTIMGPIPEFGNEDLFNAITRPPKFREVAKAKGNFLATLELHDYAQVQSWAIGALLGILLAFDELGQRKAGLAFTHSPILELALWAAGDYQPLREDLLVFPEMSGVHLEQNDRGQIRVGIKHNAPTL